jgi:hypothetical protein
MQSTSHKQKSVRHVSISFKDLIPLSTNNLRKTNAFYTADGKTNFASNGHLGTGQLKFSIRSSLKENAKGKASSVAELRRHKLKQLSLGYQLKRETLSFQACSN